MMNDDDIVKPPRGTCAKILWRLGLTWRLIAAILLPIVLLPLVFMEDDTVEVVKADGTIETVEQTKYRAAYAIIIVALFWMLELMPLAVTSLLPLVLFPFLGVLSTSQVAPAYFKETNVMFFGGLVLALAVEYCNLHKRIALKVMTVAGCSPIPLLMGVMFTSMFLSMWMSNTACCAMMLPIILAVLDQLSTAGPKSAESTKPQFHLNSAPSSRSASIHSMDDAHKQKMNPAGDSLTSVLAVSPSDQNLVTRSSSHDDLVAERTRWEGVRKMYMFGTAYASNLGGTATITGTGPNLVFQDAIKGVDISQGGKYTPMTFANWMGLNVPATIINVFVTFVYLVVRFYGMPNIREWPIISRFVKSGAKSKDKMMKEEEEKEKIKHAEKLLKQEYESLGRMNFHEWGVLIIFSGVILLWIFREPKFMKGWNDMVETVDIGDATAAILGIVLMFLVPKDLTFITGIPGKRQSYEALLDWKFVQSHLSWGVVLLLGGGFAISDGADKSGLSQFIGDQLTGLDSLPKPAILIIVMVLTAGVTEVCSNVATANVVLPILLQLSRTLDIHPLYLTIPATISCSFAFMLPVATPPNALVFSAGNLRILDMVSTGLFLNITCIIVYFLIQISYGELLFGYHNYAYPDVVNATSRYLISS